MSELAADKMVGGASRRKIRFGCGIDQCADFRMHHCIAIGSDTGFRPAAAILFSNAGSTSRTMAR